MQSRTRLIIPRLFSTNTKTTHFGFKTVHVEDKKPMVADVFHGVADQYDLMNDAMSAGIHRLWKDEFVNMLSPRPNQPGLPQFRILDVAGGTGDIAFRMASALQKTGINEMYSNQEQDDADIVVCDINSSMLRVGKDRAIQKGFGPNTRPKLDWIEGDAEKLPFESESFDAYTIAFGIRNVTDVQKALEEAHRVLRRGGRFMCLEFSHVENPLFKSVYDAVRQLQERLQERL